MAPVMEQETAGSVHKMEPVMDPGEQQEVAEQAAEQVVELKEAAGNNQTIQDGE
jgi:hypothetical protein